MDKVVITNSFEETQKLGEEFAKNLEDKRIVTLYGQLGSGKTTFVQGIAKGLGIKNRIISPTFIIIRSYKNFYHVDLYRTEGNLEELGLEEIINDPKNVVVIEWAEKLNNLPKDRRDIYFEYLENDKRKITFKNGQ